MLCRNNLNMSKKTVQQFLCFFPPDLVLKTPLFILPWVSVSRQRAFSATMFSGQVFAHYMRSVGPMTHDICITLPGSQLTVKKIGVNERMWVSALDKSWTSVGVKKAQVTSYLDMHLQPMVGHNVWKGLLKVPLRLSIELLLKKLKELRKRTQKIRIIPLNPSRDSEEY